MPQDTLRHLCQIGLAEGDLQTIEIVLAEVMNNIVEHAYATTEDGLIDLQMSCDFNALYCTVFDDGVSMPSNALPAGQRQELNGLEVQDLPEGGFGWFLIHELARDLKYSYTNNRNCLTFKLPLTRSVASA